jgi:dTDP-4-amino-4,6-dideoxygalactose transaminase
MNPYEINNELEKQLSEYTGAPYCVVLDSGTSAIILSCILHEVDEVEVPKDTYISVPFAIIHGGGKPKFVDLEYEGMYQLKPYPIWDSALRLKRDMYIPNTHMILSFGHRKQLPIGSGGALLLDNEEEYIRLKRLRYNGRPETAYHDTDDITEIGFNMILHPILASIGVEMMKTFPDNPPDKPRSMNGLDLTKFSVFKNEES